MRFTVKDCLKLESFKGGMVASRRDDLERRVRTISVLDEGSVELAVSRNGIEEQMVITHFWSFKDDIPAQCEIVKGLGKNRAAALVIFMHEDGVKSIDTKVIKTAEEYDLVIILVEDNKNRTYASMIEQVLDRVLYGHNYSGSILNNTISSMLNFDKHKNFQSALKEAAINNDYQVVLMTAEFNPILTIETRYIATVEDAISAAKLHDLGNSNVFRRIEINGVITYWGNIVIDGMKHILMIVDNEDSYSEADMKRLADIIELAMGMWKYIPERDSRAEFIKSAIRGDNAFCYTLMEEAGLKGKVFLSVFYANGINNQECRDIIDKFKEETGIGILSLIEGDEYYGMIYHDRGDIEDFELKSMILKLYSDLKEGRKDVRIFHSTGIEDLDTAVNGFKMINETWNCVEKVFPYKRVFTKYEMSMVCNCISIQKQSAGIRKMYLDLLEPFTREVTPNKGRLLLDTLETFVLDAGMNSGKTAEFMDIHNNTVQYRLKRINEILGAEMTGNRIIPGLTMALALRRLEE